MNFSRLGDVCEITMGQAPDGTTYNHEKIGLPLIAGAGDFGNLNPEPARYTAAPTKVTALGDIILCVRATIGNLNWADKEYCLGRGVAGIRPDRAKLDPKYVWWTLHTKADALAALGRGATFKQINRADIEDLESPLPALDEQRRIAAILNEADDLRRKRRETLERLEHFTSATFRHMFTETTDGQKFDVRSLGELCTLIRDGTHKTPTYVERGVPFVTVRNIVSGALDLRDTKFISEQEHHDLTRRVGPAQGDVLVSKDGTIGVPCPVLTNDVFSIFVSVALLRPKPDLVDQTFLTAQFRTASVQKQIRERSKGIAIRHLHLEDFRELRIVTPSLDLQRTFATRVVEVDKLKAHHCAHLAKLDALFASLQDRAFRGEL